MLAGLAVSIPILALVFALTATQQTAAATTAGSGAALTYILLLPAVLLGGAALPSGWTVWRRAVLPFCLATAVMWLIMGSTGRFWPLDGQFLITLFALGSWLFSLESKAARPALTPQHPDPIPNQTPDNPERDSVLSSSFTIATTPDAVSARPARQRTTAPHAAPSQAAPPLTRSRMILLSLLAMGLTALTVLLFAADLPLRAAHLVPALGALTCAGPIWMASKGSAAERPHWAAALGYAAMTAACLIPGIAGFIQPTIVAPPLYTPDAAFLVLATGLLLALADEGSPTNRLSRRLLIGAWAVWLAWVLLSTILAQHSVAQLVPADPSIWDLP